MSWSATSPSSAVRTTTSASPTRPTSVRTSSAPWRWSTCPTSRCSSGGWTTSTARSTEIDRIYIGRRHVHDGSGEPMVIDWRAPVSVPFYRATHSDRQRVLLRRRYGFSDSAELTGFEDEPMTGVPVVDQADAFLRAEIERPRTGPMRDIVATIQPEQDDLVRAPLNPSICVQGAPGTGKTAVGLHRVAYLLYTERERLRRGGVVIVGPNRSFLSYIRKVLPALGEVDVRQITIEELITQPDRRPSTVRRPPGSRATSGCPPYCVRALWSFVGTPTEGVLYSKGRAAVPGARLRGAGDRRGTARIDPVRRRPERARAAARPRRTGVDGATRGLAGRPGAERGGAVEAGQGAGGFGLAEARARAGAAPDAVRRRLPGGGRGRRPDSRRAERDPVGQAGARVEVGEVVAGRRRLAGRAR